MCFYLVSRSGSVLKTCKPASHPGTAAERPARPCMGPAIALTAHQQLTASLPLGLSVCSFSTLHDGVTQYVTLRD